MATLKVYDGTQWQVVAGQGSPGQGVPAGGVAGALLAKNTAANLDTTWTTGTLVEAGGSRVAINGPPVSNGPALRVSPATSAAAAVDIWQAPSQSGQILRIINAAGTNVPWFIDRYGYPRQFIQAGQVVVLTDAGGVAYFNFNEAFLTVPIVVCTDATNAGGAGLCVSVFNTTTTGIGTKTSWLGPSGDVVRNANVRINWFAFELRT